MYNFIYEQHMYVTKGRVLSRTFFKFLHIGSCQKKDPLTLVGVQSKSVTDKTDKSSPLLKIRKFKSP